VAEAVAAQHHYLEIQVVQAAAVVILKDRQPEVQEPQVKEIVAATALLDHLVLEEALVVAVQVDQELTEQQVVVVMEATAQLHHTQELQ
jgi:hypothetical protein